MPTKTPEAEIDAIVIGARFRREPGDIAELAQSIRELGLLSPIGLQRVDDRWHLVYGARRVAACRSLSWTHVPYVEVQLARMLDGEFAENELRKPFTPSERLAIAEAMREQVAAEAAQRVTLGKKTLGSTKGKTSEILAAKVGMSASTLAKVAAVVETAKTVPEAIPIKEAMDAGTMTVAGAHKAALAITEPADDDGDDDIPEGAFPSVRPAGLPVTQSLSDFAPEVEDDAPPSPPPSEDEPTPFVQALERFVAEALAHTGEISLGEYREANIQLNKLIGTLRTEALRTKRGPAWIKKALPVKGFDA